MRLNQALIVLLGTTLPGCLEVPSPPPADVVAPPEVVTVRPPVGCPPVPSPPELGIRRCADLGVPECDGKVIDPPTESGLHCLPEYRNVPGVPCFCVASSGSDSWCLRD